MKVPPKYKIVKFIFWSFCGWGGGIEEFELDMGISRERAAGRVEEAGNNLIFLHFLIFNEHKNVERVSTNCLKY